MLKKDGLTRERIAIKLPESNKQFFGGKFKNFGKLMVQEFDPTYINVKRDRSS